MKKEDINPEDLKKLVNLVRLDVTEEELHSLNIQSILGFIGKLEHCEVDLDSVPVPISISSREPESHLADGVVNCEYSQDILSNVSHPLENNSLQIDSSLS